MDNTDNNVIMINGTSCAGKSSLSEYLVDNLEECYEHIAWDDYVESIKQDERLSQDQKNDLISLFLKDTSEKLQSGTKLILDIVCVNTQTLQNLIDFYEPFGLLTIYMEAPADILNEREQQRPNRANGQAEAQLLQINDQENHPPYDMNFDSSQQTTECIGQQVISTIKNQASPTIYTAPKHKGFKP